MIHSSCPNLETGSLTRLEKSGWMGSYSIYQAGSWKLLGALERECYGLDSETYLMVPGDLFPFELSAVVNGCASHSLRNCALFSHLCNRAKWATCLPTNFRRSPVSGSMGSPLSLKASAESPMETWAGTTHACNERPMVRR